MISPDDVQTINYSDVYFQKLKNLIEEKTGNYFNETREIMVGRIISERIRNRGFSGLDEYLTFLNLIPVYHQEWRILISGITNNESYFFRESHHFEVMETEIIPEIHSQNRGGIIRILSAACSEGQEAYSLEIMMREIKIQFPMLSYQIYGIDIDEKALEKAKNGCYGQYSFRDTKYESCFKKYFIKSGKKKCSYPK